ncbi:MAG: hypothetical protein LBC17_04665 [Lactobacillaceae bacterium]|nr:hypothetical protein [Lactobacillaceae bacterium]
MKKIKSFLLSEAILSLSIFLFFITMIATIYSFQIKNTQDNFNNMMHARKRLEDNFNEER